MCVAPAQLHCSQPTANSLKQMDPSALVTFLKQRQREREKEREKTNDKKSIMDRRPIQSLFFFLAY